ncbi:MAG: SDR family oxidoreductase [Saprospiraceae bacterium]|nr:SDR family oxidoreductase [Saprospiraceae bacterium]
MDNSWIKAKVAIVTGGASGIGQAIAMEAARMGAISVIADIDEEKGLQTAASIKEDGGKAHYIRTDVTSTESALTLRAKAKELGPIQFLANSAGLQTYGTVDSTSEESWNKTLDVNLKSMFLVSKQILPEIRSNGGGGIVHISSIQGMRCQKNVLAYATAKGAVIAMTRSMGLDHAAEGIFVNCICPGSIDTPLLRYGAGQHGPVEEVLKEWGNHHPIGRIGTATEIAKTTLFLWSPNSNFIVGQSIVADGGLGSIIL